MAAGSVVAVLVAQSACITPRSTHAWHEGAAAEAAGDLVTAEARYTEAATGQDRLVGAELARIALMARSSDRRKDANKLLDAVLKKQPGDPLVASFAALMALIDGNPKLAAERLDASRALVAADTADIRRGMQWAKLAVAAHNARDAEATAVLADLATSPTPTAHLNALAVAVAWNAGDAAAVTKWQPGTGKDAVPWPEATEVWWLRALLARSAGDLTAALAHLEHVPKAERLQALTLLEAELRLRLGDLAGAAQVAGDAARKDPGDAELQEVWAVALLQLGEPAMARDLLAAVTARGARWSAYFHLGLAHVALGDLPAAEQAFSAAVIRCPTCKPASQNRDALRRWLAGG
jgi:tetratricopeptide (TPR) repeat protein